MVVQDGQETRTCDARARNRESGLTFIYNDQSRICNFPCRPLLAALEESDAESDCFTSLQAYRYGNQVSPQSGRYNRRWFSRQNFWKTACFAGDGFCERFGKATDVTSPRCDDPPPPPRTVRGKNAGRDANLT